MSGISAGDGLAVNLANVTYANISSSVPTRHIVTIHFVATSEVATIQFQSRELAQKAITDMAQAFSG